MDWRAHIGRWGGVFIPGDPWMRTTFIALFGLAAALRFWRLWEMDFMHDEVSALVRLYPSLGETIQRGVIALDTHPPGVQVFEWLWTRVFGTSPFAVKLPFVLFSLAALPLVYRTAMAWTQATTALLVTTLMATLQFSVLYGQLARPYAVGLFTTALLADRLTAWLAHGDRRALVGVCIAAVASAYTHHFALLLAGLMGLAGLLLTLPEKRRDFLVMGMFTTLLYLPNIPILLGQLAQGGLSGWLAPPDRWWMLDHLWWVAHTSWWLAAPLLLLVALAVCGLLRGRCAPGPALPVLLVWGIAPMVIGIAYSVWRAPVVQHSMLLFSFPYLAMALFMGVGAQARARTLGMLAVVASTSVFSLIGVRMHYALPYVSIYRTMLTEAHRQLREHGPDKVLVLFDAPPEQIAFHREALGMAPEDLPHVQLRDTAWRTGQVDSLLSTTMEPLLVIGYRSGAPAELLSRAQQAYPAVLRRVDLAEGQVHVLGHPMVHDPGSPMSAAAGSRQVAFAAVGRIPQHGWRIDENLALAWDSYRTMHCWDFTGREFGALVELLLDTVAQGPRDEVVAIAHLLLPEGPVDAAVVLELQHEGRTVFYRTGELREAAWKEMPGTARLLVSAHPSDAGVRSGAVVLRAYLHNRNGAPLGLLGMEVRVREGNPVEHGITGPVYGVWTYRPD